MLLKIVSACRKRSIHSIEVAILRGIQLHKHHIAPSSGYSHQQLPTLGRLKHFIETACDVGHKVGYRGEPSIADLVPVICLDVHQAPSCSIGILHTLLQADLARLAAHSLPHLR
ncbi:hypothetical protein D3C78_1457630 [compost metagenome]